MLTFTEPDMIGIIIVGDPAISRCKAVSGRHRFNGYEKIFNHKTTPAGKRIQYNNVVLPHLGIEKIKYIS
jgi:hypothetical protein